jgi:NAD(P)-dependent dehydrogenase (short-subunit alcohol dehydrogenase family)
MTATNENGGFAGKVAFVTGAGSGMRRTTALAFAREGARLVVADVSDQGNQETARRIEELGGQALAVRCDVTRSEVSKRRWTRRWARSGVSTSLRGLVRNPSRPSAPALYGK